MAQEDLASRYRQLSVSGDVCPRGADALFLKISQAETDNARHFRRRRPISAGGQASNMSRSRFYQPLGSQLFELLA